MKVLVLGGTGMIGHRMWAEFGKKFETYSAIRGADLGVLSELDGVQKDNVFYNIDLTNIEDVESVISELKPSLVLNCMGIVKQLKEANDSIISIQTNALFPHQLAEICGRFGVRMIQFSTDCVFSGKEGFYSETDIPQIEDIYGRTKILGEVKELDHVLTIRTSTVGREVNHSHGLLEWFLSQEGKTIGGFDKAIYSGFPTSRLAKILIEKVVPNELSGLYHIASEKINKFELCNLFKDALDVDISINKNSDLIVDRSLNADKFNKKVNFSYLPWSELVKDLTIDQDFYDQA